MANETIGRGILRGAVRTLVAAALATGVLSAQATPVSGQGTWETTLQARDLDGDPTATEAWYDTALNLLWLDAPLTTSRTWDNAKGWAAGLDVGGETGWRLPVVTDIYALGCDVGVRGTACGYYPATPNSELAHLWYVTLGNSPNCSPEAGTCPFAPDLPPTSSMTNTGPFQ